MRVSIKCAEYGNARLCAILALISHLVMASVIAADLMPVEPVVTVERFQKACGQLALSEAQSAAAAGIFQAYLADVNMLVSKSEENQRRAGLDKLHGSHIPSIPSDEIEAMGLRVVREMRRANQELNARLGTLINDLGSILSETQAQSLPEVLRELRRETLLVPSGQNALCYAGEGIDIVRLANVAMRPDEELSWMMDDVAACSAELLPETRDAVKQALNKYAEDMDRALVDQMDDAPNRAWLALLQFADSPQGKQREAHKRIMRQWNSLFDINRRCAHAIAEATRRVCGEALAQEWLQRYYAACFPQIFRDDSVDIMVRWLSKSESEPDKLKQHARIYESYKEKRASLRLRSIDVLIQAKLSFPPPSGSGLVWHERRTAQDALLAECDFDLFEARLRLAIDAVEDLRSTLSGDRVRSFDERRESLRDDESGVPLPF